MLVTCSVKSMKSCITVYRMLKKYMSNLIADLSEQANAKCNNCICYSDHIIYVDDVRWGVNKLKAHKCDVNADVSSDHIIICGCHELCIHLSFLFRIMLSHSCAPKEMLLSALVPIPMNRTKVSDDGNNYRYIAPSSIAGKGLDNVILQTHAHILNILVTSSLASSQSTQPLNVRLFFRKSLLIISTMGQLVM